MGWKIRKCSYCSKGFLSTPERDIPRSKGYWEQPKYSRLTSDTLENFVGDVMCLNDNTTTNFNLSGGGATSASYTTAASINLN